MRSERHLYRPFKRLSAGERDRHARPVAKAGGEDARRVDAKVRRDLSQSGHDRSRAARRDAVSTALARADRSRLPRRSSELQLECSSHRVHDDGRLSAAICRVGAQLARLHETASLSCGHSKGPLLSEADLRLGALHVGGLWSSARSMTQWAANVWHRRSRTIDPRQSGALRQPLAAPAPRPGFHGHRDDGWRQAPRAEGQRVCARPFVHGTCAS
jgi:hypothetical protein